MSQDTHAQKIRFTDTTNEWNVRSGCSCDAPIFNLTMKYGQDSIINGLHYRLLNCNPTSSYPGGYLNPYRGWIREDSVQKKVFFKGYQSTVVGAPPDTLERVLYDYNLLVGDTIRVDVGTYHLKHYVQRIDSTLINGVYHKYWDINAASGGQSNAKAYIVIEGIGATDQPLFPALPYSFEAYQRVYCFKQANVRAIVNTTISGRGMIFNNNCIAVGVGHVGTETGTRAQVVPNPARAGAHIRLSESVSAGTLHIYDISGRELVSEIVRDKADIPLPRTITTTGLYFFRIVNEAWGSASSGSFFFER